MIIVDTHIHVGQTWYEPIETVLYHMDTNGVAKTVLIQSGGNYDNRYEIECVRRYPERFVAVVLVDTKRPDALEVIEKLATEGVVGIRCRPTERSPGADPLAMWRKISELGWVVSMSGARGLTSLSSPDFVKLVEELPKLKIVLEHLGGAGLLTGAGVSPVREMDFGAFEKVVALSKFPNIYIKMPPFGEFVANPNQPHFDSPVLPPLRELRMAYEAFGSKRMMWGSDFPRCSGREGYTNCLKLPMENIPFFTDEDKEWVFGKTALSVWGKYWKE
jgi:L-fuconolactonase